MISFFLKLIGAGDSAGDAESFALAWHRPQVLIAGLLLLGPASWLVIRRHAVSLPHISRGNRAMLSLCRIALLLMLIVVAAGPYLSIEQTQHRKAILFLLIDESVSMQLPVGPLSVKEAGDLDALIDDASSAMQLEPTNFDDIRRKLSDMQRLDLALKVLAKQTDTLLSPLIERYDVRVFRFAGGLRRMERVAGPATDPVQPYADDTALGEALAQLRADAAGNPVAGVVLFTDGRWTSGIDPVTALSRERVSAGSQASGASAFPVFAIPVGSTQSAPDVAITEIIAPPRVSQDDVATVLATLESSGFDNRPVTVRLLEGESELDRTTVTLRDASPQQVQLTFRQTKTTGERALRLVAEPLSGDFVIANNEHPVNIEVDDERLRVLFLEGSPRWDYRFLDHAMRRDRGLEVTFVMESELLAAGAKPADLPAITKLPTTAEGFARYALVIVGDVSPHLLTPRLQEALAAAVREKGVGLIVQAGTQDMPHRYAGHALADLLPVTLARTKPRRIEGDAQGEVFTVDGIEAPAFAPFNMQVTAQGAMHPAFDLQGQPNRSRTIWSQMPAFYWAGSAAGAKPGATVLAEASALNDRVPLMAEHFAGRGRVLYVGIDSTYLWRRNAGDRYFYRFWGQAFRHVARRTKQRTDRAWLDVTPAKVVPGETASIELFAIDAHSQPRDDAALPIEITLPDSTVQKITMLRLEQPGHYRGSYRPTQRGEHRLQLFDDHARLAATLRASASGRELIRPTVDREYLDLLARTSGGRLVELSQILQLPAMLPTPAIEQSKAIEVDMWDNWLTLTVLIALYCIDVGIRKWKGLA